jgi:Rrf2 family protein
MEITHQADYALRTVMYLAKQTHGQRVSTAQIAAANGIPVSFLTKIIYQLALARIIQTSRGAGGGVWLSRSVEELSVLDVLEAVDGPILLNQCVDHPQICPFSSTCVLHVFWEETCHEFVSKLRRTTFAALLTRLEAPVPA